MWITLDGADLNFETKLGDKSNDKEIYMVNC